MNFQNRHNSRLVFNKLIMSRSDESGEGSLSVKSNLKVFECFEFLFQVFIC